MTGKYFGAKLGFLPDQGSWHFRLKDAIEAKLASLGRLVDGRRSSQIRSLLQGSKPEEIRIIAGFRDLVPSAELKTDDGRPRMVPLGYALLAENESGGMLLSI